MLTVIDADGCVVLPLSLAIQFSSLLSPGTPLVPLSVGAAGGTTYAPDPLPAVGVAVAGSGVLVAVGGASVSVGVVLGTLGLGLAVGSGPEPGAPIPATSRTRLLP